MVRHLAQPQRAAGVRMAPGVGVETFETGHVGLKARDATGEVVAPESLRGDLCREDVRVALACGEAPTVELERGGRIGMGAPVHGEAQPADVGGVGDQDAVAGERAWAGVYRMDDAPVMPPAASWRACRE